jgi:hypothetical protein
MRGEHALELVGEGGGLRRRLGFSGPCVGSWMEDANILWEGQKSSKRIAGLGRTTALHYCSSTSHAPDSLEESVLDYFGNDSAAEP